MEAQRFSVMQVHWIYALNYKLAFEKLENRTYYLQIHWNKISHAIYIYFVAKMEAEVPSWIVIN